MLIKFKMDVGFNRVDVPVPCPDPARPGQCGGLVLLLENAYTGRVWMRDGRINNGRFELYGECDYPESIEDGVEVIGWHDMELTEDERQAL